MVLVIVRPGLCTVCVVTPAALVITEVLVTVFALPVTVTVRPGPFTVCTLVDVRVTVF